MLVMGLNSGDSDLSLGWGPRLENHPPGSGLGRFINSSLYSTRTEVKTTESENSFSKKMLCLFHANISSRKVMTFRSLQEVTV